MTSVIDDYVTVPRSMVKGTPDTDKKKVACSSTCEGSSSSSTSSDASNSIPSRSDVKTMTPLVPRLMSRVKGGSKFAADSIVRTTLGTWYEDAVPSAANLNYLKQFFVDLTAEWPSFNAAYEQYRVVEIKTLTWTGELTNRHVNATTSTTSSGCALASILSRVPYVATQTMLQLADQPQLRFFDYGMNKNAFRERLRPDGCYVLDASSSPAIYLHQTGWMDCASASKHCWGSWLQQSGGYLVTGSGVRISRVMTFDVEFRRRRYI